LDVFKWAKLMLLDLNINLKVFLAMLAWAFLFHLWRKEKSVVEYQSDVLTIIACVLIGLLTWVLNN